MSLTRLGDAIVRGNLELVQKYLDEGDDINQIVDGTHKLGRFPGKNITPLIAACHYDLIMDYRGKLENIPAIIDLLLDRGADINSKSSRGCTALLLACQWPGDFIIDAAIKRMVEMGADVNVKVWRKLEDMSAYMSTVDGLCSTIDGWNNEESNRKRLECMKFLLERGADPDGGMKRGWSPLHSAVRCAYGRSNIRESCIQAAVLLILHNADLTIEDGYYETPEQHVYRINELLQYHPNIWEIIMKRVSAERGKVQRKVEVQGASEIALEKRLPSNVLKNINEYVVGSPVQLPAPSIAIQARNAEEMRREKAEAVGAMNAGRKTRMRKTRRWKTHRKGK